FFGTNGDLFSDSRMTGFMLGGQQRDVFGRKNGIEYAPYAAQRGYLVDTSALNTQHTVMHSQNYSIRASLEPIKGLHIDLSLNRQFTQNSSEYYRFNDSIQAFEAQSRYLHTNLTYTTISLGSAFQSLDKDYRS